MLTGHNSRNYRGEQPYRGWPRLNPAPDIAAYERFVGPDAAPEVYRILAQIRRDEADAKLRKLEVG